MGWPGEWKLRTLSLGEKVGVEIRRGVDVGDVRVALSSKERVEGEGSAVELVWG